MKIMPDESAFQPFSLCIEDKADAKQFAQMIYDARCNFSQEIWEKLPVYIQNLAN